MDQAWELSYDDRPKRSITVIITEVLPSTRYSTHFLISRLRVPADAAYTLAKICWTTKGQR